MEDAIDLAAKLATFDDHWQPRTVGQFNGHDLMVAKLQGESGVMYTPTHGQEADLHR